MTAEQSVAVGNDHESQLTIRVRWNPRAKQWEVHGVLRDHKLRPTLSVVSVAKSEDHLSRQMVRELVAELAGFIESHPMLP